MITTLRRLFASTLGKIITLSFVVLVGVAFALGDVTGNSSFGGMGGADVAKVGNTSIGVGDLRDRVRSAYDQARQQQPGLSMDDFIEGGGLDQALNGLIEGEAFDQFAAATGFGVSKRLVDGRISDLPVFAGVSGKFDQSRYEKFLRENGMTENQLRQEVGRQLLFDQLITPVGATPRIATAMAQPYAALLMEERAGQATFIPASPFAPNADPSDQQLQAFLAKNKSKYTVPEQRVLQYALFERASVPVPQVSDAEIAAAFKANAMRFQASETRRFSQVIAPTKAVADQIAAKVRSGSTLDAAAKAAGLAAGQTAAVKEADYAGQTSPAIAKAAFAAKAGDVVGPQQGPLGWAVIRVESIDKIPAKTLAEASEQIRSGLTANKANEAVVDYYNAVQDAVNAGAPVSEIAADRKLKIVETPPVLPSGRAPSQPGFAMSAGLAPMVGQAFQGGSEGETQLATLVENEVFAVYTVKSVIAAAPPPFAEIRGQLATDWKLAEGQKVARDKARAIVKAVEGGTTLSAAVAAGGANIGSVQSIGGKRADLAREGQRVPPEVALLFSMAAGSVKTLEIPGNRGWMVISLTTVNRPDPKAVPADGVAAIQASLGPAFGNELVEQLIEEAKRRAGVVINKEVVDQLRRELTGTNLVGE